MGNTSRFQFYRRWIRRGFNFVLVAGCLAIVLLLAIIYSPAPTYTAEARFQRVNDMALSEMKNATIANNLAMFRRSLQSDITGRDMVESVVHRLELTRGMPHNTNGQLTSEGIEQLEALIERIRANIEVVEEISAEQMDQILVRYTDPDPYIAPMIANQLVENYIVSTRASMDKRLLGARDFFLREMTKASGRVFELEKKKLDYERDHPGRDLIGPGGLRAALEESRRELNRVQKEIQVLERDENQAVAAAFHGDGAARQDVKVRGDGRLAGLSAEALLDLANDLQLKYVELELEREELASWIEAQPEQVTETQRIETDGTVTVRTLVKSNEMRAAATRDLRSLVARIRANRQLEAEARESRDASLIEARMDHLQALLARRTMLELEIQDLEIRDHNYFQVRNQYLKIEHELNDALEQLRFWDKNLQRTQVALQTEVSQRGVKHRQIERAAAFPTQRGIWGWVPWLVDVRVMVHDVLFD